MSLHLSVEFDDRDLRRYANRLGDGARKLPRLMRDAINSTAVTVRSKIVKELQRKTKIQSKGLKRAVPPISGSRRATPQRLRATITIRPAGIPAIYHGARQQEGGVSFRNVSGGRQFVRHAFIAKMRSGHKGVFIRVHGDGPSGLVDRLSIREVYGPRFIDVFREDLYASTRTDAAKLLRQRMEGRVRREISRKRGR